MWWSKAGSKSNFLCCLFFTDSRTYSRWMGLPGNHNHTQQILYMKSASQSAHPRILQTHGTWPCGAGMGPECGVLERCPGAPGVGACTYNRLWGASQLYHGLGESGPWDLRPEVCHSHSSCRVRLLGTSEGECSGCIPKAKVFSQTQWLPSAPGTKPATGYLQRPRLLHWVNTLMPRQMSSNCNKCYTSELTSQHF